MSQAKEILIVSGKGGSGKTSVAACLAELAGPVTVADCDVDAANLHLLLDAVDETCEDFWCGFEARVQTSPCSRCGACVDLCRFGAVRLGPDAAVIDPALCEGCGVCSDHCPDKAIALEPALSGTLRVAKTRVGRLVHARLGVGGENSGKLVAAVRRRARQLAEQAGSAWIVVDGPPGIGCPVIAAVGGCDMAAIVTEPSAAGLHDLRRIAELLRHFGVPAGVVINKSDLHGPTARAIRDWASDQGIPVLGDLAYDKTFWQAQTAGQSVLAWDGQSAPAAAMRQIWQRLQQTLERNSNEQRVSFTRDE